MSSSLNNNRSRSECFREFIEFLGEYRRDHIMPYRDIQTVRSWFEREPDGELLLNVAKAHIPDLYEKTSEFISLKTIETKLFHQLSAVKALGN